MAPITVGDQLPEGKLSAFNANGDLEQVDVHAWASGKKIVLIGIPGAFTPTCSLKHVPGFIEKYDDLKKYVDAVAVLSVNDPFVVREFEKSYSSNNGRVKFFADGAAVYTKALGFELDLSGNGMGLRSRRFSLVADDLIVKNLHLEEGGSFETSGVDDLLKDLSA